MPRRPRIDLAGYPLHVIQRGNNRGACFFADADRAIYLSWLGHYAEKLGVAIHAWVLMTNHVHLLVTPETPTDVSLLMQSLGRRYVRYVNARHQRSGTLWEGRFRACAVHADDYLLACMRYIESNPVRGGLADEPGGYRWSSYAHNALSRPDPLITEHGVYAALGLDSDERRAAYRAPFLGLSGEEAEEIRAATQAGHLLASARLRRQLELSQGRRYGPARRGRPPSEKSTLTPINQSVLSAWRRRASSGT